MGVPVADDDSKVRLVLAVERCVVDTDRKRINEFRLIMLQSRPKFFAIPGSPNASWIVNIYDMVK